MKPFFAVFLFFALAALAADDAPTPEPGERELNAGELTKTVAGIANTFKAHPSIRAVIRSEIEDLAGKRVEEGELRMDRANPGAARVLRKFTKPTQKAWLLDGANISEVVPSQKKIFVKDLSGAPKFQKQIQAAMTGDIKALEDMFTVRIFSKPGEAGKPTAFRLVLDKKPGVSRHVHRRIEARIAEGGLFFDEIQYIPDEGDELTEKFLNIEDASKPSDADFALTGTEGFEKKVDVVKE